MYRDSSNRESVFLLIVLASIFHPTLVLIDLYLIVFVFIFVLIRFVFGTEQKLTFTNTSFLTASFWTGIIHTHLLVFFVAFLCDFLYVLPLSDPLAIFFLKHVSFRIDARYCRRLRGCIGRFFGGKICRLKW